ncbi:MAG: hypothetical protein AB1644_05725 [Candidatus Zixiibacteriota bacterium]
MNRLKIQILLLAALLVALAVPAMGQQGMGREVVQMEMDRTQDMLDRAKEVARTYDCPLAAAPLEQARKRQEEAEQAFAQNTLLGTQTAHVLTQRARDLIKMALANCRQAEQNEAVVQRMMERAAELIDRAGAAVADSQDRNLVAIYEAAKDNLTRAWEFYRQKQYRPALKLADQVEKMAWKILGAEHRQNQREESYDRRHENVRQLLDRARSAVSDCGSESAQTMLRQANETFALAENLFGRGQVVAALQTLLKAREFALKATRECEGTDQLQARHDRLKRRLDQLSDQSSGLSGESLQKVQEQLHQAAEQLSLAQEALNSGQTDKAIAALQAAQLVIRQAEAFFQ